MEPQKAETLPSSFRTGGVRVAGAAARCGRWMMIKMQPLGIQEPGPGYLAALFSGVVGLLCAGCNMGSPAPDTTTITDGAKGVAVLELNIKPWPAKQLVPSTFMVTTPKLLPARSTVTITLTMPSMAMPPTVILAAPTGKMVYAGSGMFSMGGDWQAEIMVDSGGKKSVRAVTVAVE